jgi:hypothetical protein
MTTEVLRKKTARYLCGMAVPAEKMQIQTWLSCTDNKAETTPEERQQIEDDIVAQVMAYVDSTLTFQSKSDPWWKRITASF